MTKQEATDIFCKIRSEYLSLPFPKYQNADFEDLKKKYEILGGLRDHLSENALYHRLMNSISQTIARLSNKGTWFNISERGINKSIPPVIKKGEKEIEFPFRWVTGRSDHACFINGYWDDKNYMVMDVLGYFLLLKEGGDRLPEDKSNVFDDLESIKAREIELNQQRDEKTSELPIEEAFRSQRYSVRFNDAYFRKFTGKCKMHSNEILNLLLETSRVEFRIAFPVRLQEGGRSGIKEKWYSMNLFSRPFEMGYTEAARKDGIVQERTYYIFFNTILGELFVHNLLTKGYDRVSNSLYNLPPSAQIFYRRLLLHHDFHRIELNLETIARTMNFTDKNRSNLMSSIEENSLKPLERKGLILSYKKVEGLHGVKYEILLPDKKQRGIEGLEKSIEGPEKTIEGPENPPKQ
ncbi:MAG: hypothetical protein ACLQGU_08265 [bacterium]